MAAIGTKVLSFRSKDPSHTPGTKDSSTASELSLQNTIWELPKPKRRNTKYPRCPPIAIQTSKERDHHHRYVARRRDADGYELVNPKRKVMM